jgi:sialic acid synthase SpsE
MLILDLGSGNTSKNSIDYACQMVKAVADLKLPDVVIKWQLFKESGENVPLMLEVFERAYRYAAIFNIRTTASVFDKDSLDYLLTFGVPFVKIVNRHIGSQMLIADIPDSMPVVVSVENADFKMNRKNTDILYCVSKYPADEKDYAKFGDKLKIGISDHTTNFNLYKKYNPKIYECHFCLDNSSGLDAGKFARRPKDFKYMTVDEKEEKRQGSKPEFNLEDYES